MKERYARTYMKTAFVFAELSYCKRKQVGCVIVKDDRIISYGFNGTPPGWDNVCEDESGFTKPEVLHAEANAVAKLAKYGGSGIGSSIFVSLEPCLDCAKQLASMGIKELYYSDDYDRVGHKGIDFLHKCNIPVYQLQLKEEKGEEENDKKCCKECK